MTLYLRRTADEEENYTVFSGNAPIGRIRRYTAGGQRDGWYQWVINRVLIQGSMGWAETREAAMQDLARRWRTWLELAGLQEKTSPPGVFPLP